MSFGPPISTIVSGGGIGAGTPFTLGNIPVVSQATPPFVVDSLLRQTTATATVAQGIVVGATDTPYDAASTAIAETFRTMGGAIFGSGSSSYVTRIGRGATFQGTDSINTLANASGVVIGASARANANQGVALGPISYAQGQADISIGYTSTASGNGTGAIAIGAGATSSGGFGVAIGSGTFASGFGVALGNASTSVTSAICIGSGLTGYADSVFVGGSQANSTTGRGDVGIGGDIKSFGSSFGYDPNVVIGYQSGTRGGGTSLGCVTVGATAQVTHANARYSIVIGSASSTAFDGSITIGKGMTALSAREIAIGINDATYGPSTSLRLGGPDTDTAARNFAIRFINMSGANIAGGTVTWTAPLGTGTGSGADLIWQTGILQSPGSTLQSAGERLRLLGGVLPTTLALTGPSATADARLSFSANGGGTATQFFGAPGAAGNLVTGSAVGDLVARVLNKSVHVCTDGGATIALSVPDTAALAAESMALLIYDKTGATLKQVTRGAANSGGAGFRQLLIPN